MPAMAPADSPSSSAVTRDSPIPIRRLKGEGGEGEGGGGEGGEGEGGGGEGGEGGSGGEGGADGGNLALLSDGGQRGGRWAQRGDRGFI